MASSSDEAMVDASEEDTAAGVTVADGAEPGDDSDVDSRASGSKMRHDAPEFVPQAARAPASDQNSANLTDVEVASVSSAPSASDGEEDRTGEEVPPGYREVRGQLRSTVPNRWMSPLEVHFSQMRARERFRCERLIEESVPEVTAVLLDDDEAARLCRSSVDTSADDEQMASPGHEHAATSSRATVGVSDSSEAGNTGKVWRLDTPFPAIEVLRWCCKLRDPTTGRPKIDVDTGAEVYDTEERFFTLDNRRLYCLQKAAAKVWPDKAIVAVIELPPGPLSRSRELRKFRTLDRGRSIFIGGRGEGEELVRWSWRATVGIEAPTEAETDATAAATLVKRRPAPSSESGADKRVPQGQGHGQSGRGQYRPPPFRPKRPVRNKKPPEENGGCGFLTRLSSTPGGGFAAFLGIYLALRVVTKVSLSLAGVSNSGTLTEQLTRLGGEAGRTPLLVVVICFSAFALAVVMQLVLKKTEIL